jgi:Ca2+-binding RTX toxin-like protein
VAKTSNTRDTTLAALVSTDSDPLAAPRIVAGAADTIAATEDGGAVVAAVLANDTGVVRVAQINGAAVVPGQVITLASGAQILVNANGTLSFLVNGAYQQLGAGQTATETFTYTAADPGGSPIAPDGVFSAANITAARGFVINGAAANDLSGYSVSGIGDIDGNGVDDILVGALQADPGGRTNAGTSYVILGRAGGYASPVDLGALNGTNGFAIRGVAAVDYSGTSVKGIGDVNGDGRADFVIGAPWADSAGGANAGAAYVVFGRAGGFGAAGLDLSSLNGTNGFVIRGQAGGDGLGFAVSAAGDLNNDGRADLVVGAREADPGGDASAGKTYVIFGKSTAFSATLDVASLNGTNGFTLNGVDAGDLSGRAMGSGDFNNDGIDDLIIGASQGDPGGRANAGEAYVLFGRNGGGFGANVDLGALNGTNGFIINGIDAGDMAGWSVSSAGDLNADGIEDIAIGALYGDPSGRSNAGEVYVLYGRNGGFGASLNLSAVNVATGFTISGAAASGLAGHTVASAGDVNADGIDDLLIGALYADPAGGGTDAGESYVLFGRVGGFGTGVDLLTLNGLTGFAVGGGALGGFSGQSVSAAGDVNGDGIDDLIIGSPNADPSGRTDAGVSYVLYGAANISRLTSPTTVTVTITGTNDAPVITSNGGGANATTTIAENATAVITAIQAVDIDSGTTLTYSIAGGADAARFTINSTTGALAFVTAANFEAPTDAGGNNVYDVLVQASDGTAVDTQAIAVTVTNQNETPTITSNGGGAAGAISLAENTPIATTVTATDPDGGAMLTYSIIGGPDAGDFAINPTTGVLSFVSGPSFAAPTDANLDNIYTVVVQASDGVLTDTQTLNITVTNTAQAPIITSAGGGANGAYSLAENGLVVATAAATDPNGTIPTWSIAGGADAAKFKINAATGLLEFKVAPNFESPTDVGANNVYDVIIRASDGSLSDTQALAITVTNTAEAPTITTHGGANNAARSVMETNTAIVTMAATDQDAGTTLTWSIAGGADAAFFLIDASTGALRLANAQNFEAPADAGADNVYDVIVQVSDGVLEDKQSLAVTITNVNEAPVITSDGAGTQVTLDRAEGSTLVTKIAATDPDAGTSLSFAIVGGVDAARFLLDPVSGDLRFATPPDFEAPTDQGANNSYQVIVEVSDGAKIDRQTITVRVTDVAEGLAITSDGGGPTAALARNENSLAVTTVTAAGAGLVTYSIAGGADQALFAINPTTGVLSFVNAPNFEAPTSASGSNVYDVVVRATDASGSDTQAISVTIQNLNEAPVITSNGGGAVGGYTILENTLGPNPVMATDPEGAPLAYSIVGGADAARFTINSATGILQLAANPNFEAPADANADNVYQVIVQASDGTNVDTQTINLTVTNQNEAPVITSNGGGPVASRSVVEGNTAVSPTTATDPDAGTTLAYSIVGGADQALFTINAVTGALAFASTRNFEAPTDSNGDNIYNVVIQVSDGVNVDTQAFNVTVTNRNEAPVITSNGGGVVANISRPENGTPFVTTVTATDPDAATTFTYSISGGADAGLFTIDATTGELSFVTAPDFEAPADANGDNRYIVTVRTFDGALADTQTLNIFITNLAEGGAPPVITSNGGGPSAAINVAENTSAVTTVTATDADGPSTVYSIVGGADQGLFTINAATGVLNFVSARDFETPTDSGSNNVYDVIVQASDGGKVDTQAVAVTITNVNEPPVITSSGGGPSVTIGITEGQIDIADVDATDPDAGASVTYSLVGGADQGLFVIDPTTGLLQFASAQDFENPQDSDLDGRYNVVVQASDGTGFDTQAIEVILFDLNEGPVITSNGGGPTATIEVAENNSPVTEVTATDPDAGASLTYSIFSGADAALFTIDSSTGQLSFITAPDFEAPQDADLDNVYLVNVRVFDGLSDDVQEIAVTVTDQGELTPPSLTDLVGSISVNEGQQPYRIDSDVTYTDPVATWLGGTLTVSGLVGTDIVGILSIGTGPGEISASGSVVLIVLYEGVTIGTATGGAGSDLVVSFNANATRASIEALVEALTYRSSSDIAVAAHDLSVTIVNGAFETIGPVNFTVGFVHDALNGTAGDDFLSGLRGDDVINGFDGLDNLFGGEGADTINGGQANDVIHGEDDNDTLNGDQGDDLISGGQGVDVLTGGDGLDTLNGDDGNDNLSGDASDDTLNGGLGADFLNGGGADDNLDGGDDNDTLRGEDGHDTLSGGAGDDALEGGLGHDDLKGDAGIDNLDGGEGDDILSGGADNDTLTGGDGLDVLSGGDGADVLDGGLAADELNGGAQNDSLQGGEGDDRLNGGEGSDRIDGGNGTDTAIYLGSIGSYLITFGPAGEVFVDDGAEVDTLINVEFLEFGDFLLDVRNDPPQINSNGGGTSANLFRLENTFSVTTVSATDPQINDIITYSIVGGEDSGLFTINADTGDLEFLNPVDFEAPSDADGDNVYEVIVAATDQRGAQDTQAIFVQIEDENEVLILPPKGEGEPLETPTFTDPPDSGWFL